MDGKKDAGYYIAARTSQQLHQSRRFIQVKNFSSLSARFLPLVLLALVAFGCKQSETTTIEPTNMSTTSSGGSSATAKAVDIAGTYDITGTNENGAGEYKGTLLVKNRGDVYQFSWDTAGKTYDGVGVQTGNSLGVAFAEGDSGEGCGVVLYKIGAEGTLEGKAGYWGKNSGESETAIKKSDGPGLEGDYSVLGKNTDGKSYSGSLVVKKEGAGYTFAWEAGTSLKGFGVHQAGSVAVGIGGTKCGFVSYEVSPDGTLNGKWGGYGSTSVGTETAMKRK